MASGLNALRSFVAAGHLQPTVCISRTHTHSVNPVRVYLWVRNYSHQTVLWRCTVGAGARLEANFGITPTGYPEISFTLPRRFIFHEHTSTHAQRYIYICVCVYIPIYMYIDTCIYIYIYIYLHPHTCTYVYICICICLNWYNPVRVYFGVQNHSE